jgi:hypothetical protein
MPKASRMSAKLYFASLADSVCMSHPKNLDWAIVAKMPGFQGLFLRAEC